MAKPAKPSLADAIDAGVKRMYRPRCSFTRLDLDDADRAALTAALTDRAIPAAAISAGLKALGHAVNPDTVRRHRNGDCTCPR